MNIIAVIAVPLSCLALSSQVPRGVGVEPIGDGPRTRGGDVGKRADEIRLYRPAHAGLGANLSGASLSGADLSGAYGSEANLARAKLRKAQLTRAQLSGANFMRPAPGERRGCLCDFAGPGCGRCRRRLQGHG